MTAHIDPLEPDAERAGASPRVVLTVRLYGGTDDLLLEEFANLGRRRRAARATQLLFLGLLFERARLGPRAAMMATPPSYAPRATSQADYGLAPEADAFLSAILRCAKSAGTCEERGGGLTFERSSADQSS
jgi:hypothetical protein